METERGAAIVEVRAARATGINSQNYSTLIVHSRIVEALSVRLAECEEDKSELEREIRILREDHLVRETHSSRSATSAAVQSALAETYAKAQRAAEERVHPLPSVA